MFHKQIEQFPIHLVPVQFLVVGAGPSMLHDPEVAREVPQRVAPAKLLVQAEQVVEPAQRNIVGRFVVAAAFPDMYCGTSRLHIAPRLVKITQHVTIPRSSVPFLPWILWFRRGGVS